MKRSFFTLLSFCFMAQAHGILDLPGLQGKQHAGIAERIERLRHIQP